MWRENQKNVVSTKNKRKKVTNTLSYRFIIVALNKKLNHPLHKWLLLTTTIV